MAAPAGAEVPLAAVLDSIESVDEDLVLFTRGAGPVTRETPVLLLEDEGDAPPGARYFLEVSVVNDVLCVWSRWRQGARPTAEDKCAAVLHYATHDAYLPVTPVA